MTGDTRLITVGEQAAGSRLDSFLASLIPEISRTRIRRAIEEGEILINDRTVKPSYKLHTSDRIEIDLVAPPPLDIEGEPIPLNIVYEDEDLLVVDKPAGLVVHPGAGVVRGTLANALVYHFDELSGRAGAVRPGIVHRIDKETSGLLVVAKNEPAHEGLSEQFKERKVYKLYIALVYGSLSIDHGEIETRVGRSPHNRAKMAVLAGDAGRPAHTAFQVAERYNGFTLLRVNIKTGRTHQIRVHMSHIGHPVVGDIAYGRGRENSVRDPILRRAIREFGRHFLHAAELAFLHPRTGARLEFRSPLPEELGAFLRWLA